MGILLGLVAALGWGAGDFFARYATQRIGTYRTLFYMQFVGIIGLGLYLVGTGTLQSLLASNSWVPWGWTCLAAIVNIVSSLALYRAFEVGTLTLVSPVAASYAAITVILSYFSGEVLTPVHAIAIGVILLGVIVVSATFTGNADASTTNGVVMRQRRNWHGVGWALLASVGYGLTFWLLGFHVTPALGGIVPVWLVRLLTPCLLGCCAPLVRQPLKWPRGSNIWWFLLGVSIFDTVAYLAYAIGLTLGHVSIVTMLSSLYSAVTVLLAWIVLRERLQHSQWFGIGVIFFGIVLISI